MRGDNQSRRLILETVGSNLSLSGKILSIAAKKPFAPLAKSDSYPHRLGVVDDVRTLRGKFARLVKRIWRSVQDEDGQRILQNIKALRERFEPEVVAKEDALRYRRAKAAARASRARGAYGSSHRLPLS